MGSKNLSRFESIQPYFEGVLSRVAIMKTLCPQNPRITLLQEVKKINYE